MPPTDEVPLAIPRPVRALLDTLERAGATSVLVGGCVRDALDGVALRDFDVATPARPERVLALFPRAIPIGLRHGTVMVPTAAGPVDVTSFRQGGTLAEDLAHRDFTLNALAFDVRTERLIDPSGGREDLRARRLRAVGRPRDRMAEDPLRAWRAARLLAERGFVPDAALREAMADTIEAFPRISGERLRGELERILVSDGAVAGLSLLFETGLAQALAPGVSRDAAERVAAMPVRKLDRLAAWLLGTAVRPTLARLRLGRAAADRIDRWLRAHPVHVGIDPGQPADLRRLLHRQEREDLETLLALASVAGPGGEPISAGTGEQVATLRRALAEVAARGEPVLERTALALDGADVMRLLETGPGPVVGEALRYLMDRVLEDPTINTPERLRGELGRFAAERR